MKLFKKLNSRGHTHIVIPLLVVLLIGGIGTFVATHSSGHALTITKGVVTYSGNDDGCGGNATHYLTYGGHTYHVGRSNYGSGSICKCTNGRWVPYGAVSEPPSRANGWCTYTAYTGGDDGCGGNATHYYGSIHVSRSITTTASVCKCTNGRTIYYLAVKEPANSHNYRCDTNTLVGPPPAPAPAPKPSASGYINPFRAAHLSSERIDQGVDFGGTGPIYALGSGKVVHTYDGGWPGGVFIVYQLTSGRASGKYVYVAEDCSVKVSIGQAVSSNTELCYATGGGDGMETGWAQAPGNGWYALAHVVYHQHSDGYATSLGQNFSQLLHSLGAPYGNISQSSGRESGGLPSGWPIW